MDQEPTHLKYYFGTAAGAGTMLSRFVSAVEASGIVWPAAPSSTSWLGQLRQARELLIDPESLSEHVSALAALELCKAEIEAVIQSLSQLSQTPSNKGDIVSAIEQRHAALKPTVEAMAAFVGISGVVIKLLSPEQMQNYQWSDCLNDLPRVIYTVHDWVRDKNQREALVFALRLLQGQLAAPAQEKLSVNARLLYRLCLDVVYARYGDLEEPEQKMVLINYYCAGIAVGAPVEVALKKWLYNTREILSFMARSAFLSENLEHNSEILVTKITQQPAITFIELYRTLPAIADEKMAHGIINRHVISRLDRLSSPELEMVARMLEIVWRIRNTALVSNNRGGELTELEKYNNDMILLITWFGIGEAGAEPLTKYFSADTPRVPLASFIDQLKDIANLTDQVTIDNIMELTDLLHHEAWLPEDQELIMFHEADGQWHWNKSD